MLTILKIHLPTDSPIVGCELKPYILIRRADSSVTTEDIQEGSQPEGSQCLKSRWYRSSNSRKTAVCTIHPSEAATIQCIGCLKSKVATQKSYHCTSKCFVAAWPDHKTWHANPTSTGLPCTEDEAPHYLSQGRTSLGSREGADEWVMVGHSRAYTPSADDIGHTLKFEVTPCDTNRNVEDAPSIVNTGRVIPLPNPPTRKMLPVEDSPTNSSSRFTVMTYNVLADLYATSEMYTYTPGWALSWGYRKQALLREILGQGADIVCLQEVQSDHYEDFFQPEMQKAGYTAVYKMKTAAVYTGSTYTIDGCATFFRTDRFTLVKKYEVEFNKAALSLSEALSAANQKKAALNRLLKDNVALIVVLDSLEGPDPDASVGKRQLVCVANTHIHANPELKDVKLWQVHTLLKGLEKIAASADIPMLVTGDFNSTPGSAPHSLLANGRVDASHPELATDPLGILRPPSKLCHQLPLMSAYSSMANPGISASIGRSESEKHMRRVDATEREPLFTNHGADFTGTLDYLFYTANSLVPTKLLELPDKADVTINGSGMPNSAWSSDHLALMAEFQFKTQ